MRRGPSGNVLPQAPFCPVGPTAWPSVSCSASLEGSGRDSERKADADIVQRRDSSAMGKWGAGRGVRSVRRETWPACRVPPLTPRWHGKNERAAEQGRHRETGLASDTRTNPLKAGNGRSVARSSMPGYLEAAHAGRKPPSTVGPLPPPGPSLLRRHWLHVFSLSIVFTLLPCSLKQPLPLLTDKLPLPLHLSQKSTKLTQEFQFAARPNSLPEAARTEAGAVRPVLASNAVPPLPRPIPIQGPSSIAGCVDASHVC